MKRGPVIKASKFFRPTVNQQTPESASGHSNKTAHALDSSLTSVCPATTRPAGACTTESIDLETIVNSADTTHGTAQQEIVAEMSAVAEEFVTEQQHQGHSHTTGQTASSAPSMAASLQHTASALTGKPAQDRRRKHRALISAPIRVRGIDVTSDGPDEIATTVDVSRVGILLHTRLDCYYRAMEVAVVFPYSNSQNAIHAEQIGRVARITDVGDGTRAVAIALGTPEAIATSSGVTPRESLRISTSTAPETKKPLVLAMDTDETLRDTLKNFLQNEGYDVIAVDNAADAREVLNLFTPALIVAEVEGDGTPGYDICAFVKASPRLKQIPVVLTTNSAYPSDYANAHALGAVVCMAKPYKQDRMGHIVRLLAPLPEHLRKIAAPRAADPTRLPGRDCTLNGRMQSIVRGNTNTKKSNINGTGKSRFKFPSFR